MAAETPFSISGNLTFPPDVGQPNVPIPFTGSGTFKSRPADVLNLTGSGTQSINFGSIPTVGAKAILIEVDADTTGAKAPVNLEINGGGAPTYVELSPGGMFMYFNPAPLAGVASIDIVHTTDNCVRVWILGD